MSDPPDVERFVKTLGADAAFFDRDEPAYVARAPGRLDVMGGIADYSGSLVLELPLADATFVAAQRQRGRAVTVHTLRADDLNAQSTVTVPIDDLFPQGRPLDYHAARRLLSAEPRTRWAAYVIGALIVLAHDHDVRFDTGVRLLVDSTVPPSKGVASSAALEVASMQALCALHGIRITGRDLALACQKVENLVVGAPCGVMDQMTSACGEAGRLLALECQPAELRGYVSLPPELEVWGIDSGIRHEVGGAEYGDVRVAAFMGYRIIASAAGMRATPAGDGHVRIEDARWRGYLANVTPSEWEREFRNAVPESMHGRDFLARFSGITDATTRVDPARTYAVRRATAHPIGENDRVRRYRELLERGASTDAERRAMGELMYESHASYSACGLGSSGTDRLVELVRAAGEALYGAKITGGGSGGVVAVLARRGSHALVSDIAARYAQETGRAAGVLGGSSAGAMSFGVHKLHIEGSST
ncbi:MAG TPA: galactokinase family protein [Gemmatimonadaceae bacterium]|nr:galactokinase family protein [Gemmatimonadaceae bacterium]